MTAAILWLVFELGITVLFWHRWTGWSYAAFITFMGVAVGTQLYAIWDIYRRTRNANKILRDVLLEASDKMYDTTRLPGDNSPYPRYQGLTPDEYKRLKYGSWSLPQRPDKGASDGDGV